MNKLQNLGIQPRTGFQKGNTIKLIGGENTELSKIVTSEIPTNEVIKRIPTKTSDITYEIKSLGKEELISLRNLLYKRISLIKKAMKKLAIKSTKQLNEYKFVEKVYQQKGVFGEDVREAVSYLDGNNLQKSYYELYKKRNVLTFLCTKRNYLRKVSMTNQEIDYEIVKGVTMNKNKIEFKESEFENEYGIKETIVTRYLDYPYFKNGSLKAHDLVVLHNSGRLGFRINGKIVRTNELEEYSSMEAVLDNARKDGAKVILPTILNYPANNTLVDLDDVERVEYNIKNDAVNGLARDFLDSLRVKDCKHGFKPITEYNEKSHGYDVRFENVLVLNLVAYEPNKIVLVGTKRILEAIDRTLQEKNSEGCYYNFSGQELIPYNKEFKGRVSQRLGFHIDDYRGVSSLFGIRIRQHFGIRKNGYKIGKIPITLEELTPKQFRRTEEGVVGLNELSRKDGTLKKYLRSFDFPGVPRDNSEAEELFEIAEDVFREEEEEELLKNGNKLFDIADSQDGRFSQNNIEHELRKELKYLKQKSSKELYFLFKYVDENKEYKKEVEIVNGKRNTKLIYNKKHMALRNVVQSYKMLVENHEEEAKGLTSDLEDLVTIEKGGFKADRTSKNLYDQQKGLLNPNQNPQKMDHIPEMTKEALESFKEEAKQELREREEDAKLLRVTKEVKCAVRKDGSYSTVEIFDLEATKALGGSRTGGLFHIPSGKPPIRFPEKTMDFSNKEKKNQSQPRDYYPLWMYDTLGLTFEDKDDILEIIREVENHLCRPSNILHQIRMQGYFGEYPVAKVFESMPGWFCPPKEMVLKDSSEKIEDIDRLGMECRNIYNRNSKMNMTNKYDQPMAKEGEKVFVFEYVPNTVTGRPHYKGMKSRATFQVGHHDWVSTKKGKKNQEEISSSYSSLSNYRIIGEEKGIYLLEMKIEGVPKLFYAQGNLKALQQTGFGISGTRHPQGETIKFIRYVVPKLVEEGCVIISGLAKGCDYVAHKACLDAGGITIAVLPSGIKRITPSNNKGLARRIIKNGGLLLSEYDLKAPARKHTYTERNRVIANLSDEILICEAGYGTLNTYKQAKELNKKVFVQDIDTPNNLDLIENKDEDILLI